MTTFRRKNNNEASRQEGIDGKYLCSLHSSLCPISQKLLRRLFLCSRYLDADRVNKCSAVSTLCRFHINWMATVVCLPRPHQHEASLAVRPLKSYDNGVISLRPLTNCPPMCSFSLPRLLCIRLWKKAETACPSQPITCCPHQLPVWETSRHWTSPTMRTCPQTPATRLTHRKRVSVVWAKRPQEKRFNLNLSVGINFI